MFIYGQKDIDIDLPTPTTGYFYNSNGEKVNDDSFTNSKFYIIDISKYIGYSVLVNIKSNAPSSLRRTFIMRNNETTIYVTAENVLNSVDDYSKFTHKIPYDGKYLYISCILAAEISVKIRNTSLTESYQQKNRLLNNAIYAAALANNFTHIDFNNGAAVINNGVEYTHDDLSNQIGFTLYPNTDYYIIKFRYTKNAVYLLEASSSSYDLSYFVMFSNGEIIPPLIVEGSDYKWLVSKELIGDRDGIEFRLDNRSGKAPITIDRVAAFISIIDNEEENNVDDVTIINKNNIIPYFDTTNQTVILHFNFIDTYYYYKNDNSNTNYSINYNNIVNEKANNAVILSYNKNDLIDSSDSQSTVNRYLCYDLNSNELKIYKIYKNIAKNNILLMHFFATISTASSNYNFIISNISNIYYIDGVEYNNQIQSSDIYNLDYIFRNCIHKDLTEISNTNSITQNQDGTITIAPGGFYFPGIAVHGYFNGDCHIRIRLESTNAITSLYAAKSIVTSGGGYDKLPFTLLSENESVNETVWYLHITDTDYDKANSYTSYILRIDNRQNANDIIIKSIEIVDSGIPARVNSVSTSTSIAYVSTNGSDDNVGSKAMPFASVTQALQSGANYILVEPGIYHENINFTDAQGKITLLNNGTYNLCKFLPDDESKYILSKTETKVDGYNNVYKASSTVTLTQYYLFQNGVNDLSTEILDSERLPQQRGMKYRCENTKLQKCSMTQLSTALHEIETCTDNVYKFFQDPETLDVYFCRPQEVSETNYLAFPGTTTLFNGLSKNVSLEVIGIECMYMSFNVSFADRCKIVDCKAGYNQASGAFIYNRQVGTEFIRCEAIRCINNSNGDGFNGHSINAGDIYSKQTTVSLIDCWSHDNYDDGYSDHERSEITIQGGLYEWNGKGGIVPSYGSHCTCYNVYSRNNFAGFYYVGDVDEAEGGIYGQMSCFYCHAENNNRGGAKTGFGITGNGNRMELIGCTSIGNNTGYSCGTNNVVRMIDCKALNNSVSVTNFPETANVEIITTDIVSAQ